MNRLGTLFMSKIKFYTAILAANSLSFMLKMITKSSGTSFPGMVGLKICPEFINLAQDYSKKGIINITGTNGKTTTAGLFAHILSSSGKKILHNEKGANMLTGIASTLLEGVGFDKEFDYFVLESDEAYLTKLYDKLKADYLVVTNLFRDQLDRYGELDTTFKKIQEAIDKNKDLTVVLNADDPLVSALGKDNKKIFYGFERIEFTFEASDANAPAEAVECPVCGANLYYHSRTYAHVGNYYCHCGYKRPELKYSAQARVSLNYSELKVKEGLNEYDFKVNLPGLYNVYNALAAISVALELGISKEEIQNALDSYQSVFGRAESLVLKEKNVLVQLIKNPVGASEVLRIIGDNKKSKLLIILNDNYADGRDVSWIWDANFEILKDYDQPIIVSGDRAYDMALRLKYAGVNQQLVHIEKDIREALNGALALTQEDETLLVLPTYTALLKMQNIIKRRSFTK